MSEINLQFINSKKLSEALNIPLFTIREYTRKKIIPAYKIGKHYRYRLSDVIDSIEKNFKIN